VDKSKLVVNVLTHYAKSDPEFSGDYYLKGIRINGRCLTTLEDFYHEPRGYVDGVLDALKWVYGEECILFVSEQIADQLD